MSAINAQLPGHYESSECGKLGEAKDYHLTVTVKNNLMLRMMELHKIDTVAELSRRTGIDQGTLGDYLKLLASPYNTKNGKLRPSFKKLCDFFKCLPDHIFPEGHLYNPLETNTSSIEVGMDELKNLPGFVDDSIDAALVEQDVRSVLSEAMKKLSQKQQQILSLRFGLLDGHEYTLEQISKKYGVTSNRICQIEQQALRKLRRGESHKNLEEVLTWL